ncbi:hypothetical protein PRZ48_014861 [Zasmidium cellare]|uniref:Uncharacterized protein n=1 Tax=Zasmidium cellare TaxID=395010 RepID=A0ABR0DXJ0_ZASCE|nr:hypothetical protein PRZ48_014861 [Zasmidium cellare]
MSSAPPSNAPTGPKNWRPPPLTDRQCHACPSRLEADDKYICKPCQVRKADQHQTPTEIPLPHDKWSSLLGEGDNFKPIRRALQATRRKMPDASRLEVALAREAQWDDKIDGQVVVASKGERQMSPEPVIFMEDLRRVIGQLRREEGEADEQEEQREGADQEMRDVEEMDEQGKEGKK